METIDKSKRMTFKEITSYLAKRERMSITDAITYFSDIIVLPKSKYYTINQVEKAENHLIYIAENL